MGKTITPKYRIEYFTVGGYAGPAVWRGLPTKARLLGHLRELNRSYEPGGVNAHLRAAHPTFRHRGACIVRQADNTTVAEVDARAED